MPDACGQGYPDQHGPRDMDLLKSQIIRRMGPEDISRLIGLWGKLADIMEDEMHQLLERRKKRTEERP